LPATSAAATWPAKIASGKFHGLMQTKTPAAVQLQLVALAGGAGQRCGAQAQLGLVGVVAAEVDRLAHFGDAVAERLVRFLHEQAAELGQARFERVGGAPQRAARSASGVAFQRGWPACRRAIACATSALVASATARTRSRRRPARAARAREHARSTPSSCAAAVRRTARRRRDAGAAAARAARRAARRRRPLVGELMHERRIRAVLEQAAHEVGEQVAVLADRRVDAHRHRASRMTSR
jgi:hypothetical protein